MDDNGLPPDEHQPPVDPVEQPVDAHYDEITPVAPAPTKTGKLAVVVIALILIGIGSGVFVLFRSGASERPIDELVPADVAVYAKVSLDPSTSQKAALRSMLGKLPEAQRDTVSSSIDHLLERTLESQNISYRDDVKPWLGDQIAITASVTDAGDPDIVAVLSAKDDARARTTLAGAARTHSEIAYDVADGFAYVGNSDTAISGLRSRAARAPLSKDAGYIAEHERLGGDGLFFVYVDGAKLGKAAAGANPLLSGGAAAGKGAASLRAESGGFVMVGHQKTPPGLRFGTGEPDLVSKTSGALLGELSLFDLGKILEQTVGALSAIPTPSDEGSPATIVDGFTSSLGLDIARDIIPWLHGEFSVVVGGLSRDGQPDVGVLIEPTDKDALTRTLRALQQHLGPILDAVGGSLRQDTNGFTVHTSDVDIVVRRGSDRLVIATGTAYATKLLGAASDALEDDTVYKRVLGGPANRTLSQVFIRVDRVRAFVEAALPAEERTAYEHDVKPWLSLFDAFGARATLTGTDSDFRAVLSLAE